MNLWKKIKTQQRNGKETVADKASDLLESCSDFVLKNVQKYTQETVYIVKLRKLQTEVDTLRQMIRNRFTALGGQVYVLYTTEKKSAFVENIRNHIDKLKLMGKKEAVIEAIHTFNPKTPRREKADARKKVPVCELLA